MTFKPDHDSESELEKQMEDDLGPALRDVVRSVRCPDHPDHDPPDVVRTDDRWRIVACCKRGTELATQAIRLGRRQLRKQIVDELTPALRDAVRSVRCPNHPDHDPPEVVRTPDGWQILACCERSAELAAQAAGLDRGNPPPR